MRNVIGEQPPCVVSATLSAADKELGCRKKLQLLHCTLGDSGVFFFPNHARPGNLGFYCMYSHVIANNMVVD